MKVHAIWATAIVLAIAAIAHASSQYNIEEEKQNAFMMKVCTDAGGKWTTGWRVNVWWCERLKP